MTLQEYIEGLRGKRIGVVGIGVSNKPLMELLLKGGCDVTACDKTSRDQLGDTAKHYEALGAKLQLGPDYLNNLDFDVIFRTPGLHPNTPQLIAARERGCVITSEMEAFFKLCPCHTVAITGSDGKTTTTTIIAEMLRAKGYTVHLGGNIGKPLLADVPNMKPEDYAVLELSSFQLHGMYLNPDVAVVTNLSPNHLDVHPDYADYLFAKEHIFRNQTPDKVLVLNQDNARCEEYGAIATAKVRWFSREKAVVDGVFARDDMVYRSTNYMVDTIMPTASILLPGDHNVENYLAAFAAVESLVDNETCRNVAQTFKGVPHRLEIVRKLNGVTFCNDSIATSPTRTIAGLRSFDCKPVLIAGGHDKYVPFGELGEVICRRAKALFLTGDTADKIRVAVENSASYDPAYLPISVYDDFDEAVYAAIDFAEEGDVVLLSPACSSYDRFLNFAQRGNCFRDIVMSLQEEDLGWNTLDWDD
ncbi:MAG: UDP-N-acetylmuramoyl-L-alanine--D-glutamate ligase [Eubacteriales bacterium]|nr:UDP-N-acetylmuramoyl-L-alanine--D-glutamate ligase [Eubacteriales bacterium]